MLFKYSKQNLEDIYDILTLGGKMTMGYLDFLMTPVSFYSFILMSKVFGLGSPIERGILRLLYLDITSLPLLINSQDFHARDISRYRLKKGI